MIKLIVFDLDGTLLNTIADLGNSTNYALTKLGYPTHDIISYRSKVGNGINKLFERSLPENERTEENISRVRYFFLNFYDVHCTDKTVPYPGVPLLLQNIQEKKILIAIASNKYQKATSKLIHHFFKNIAFAEVLGQRENVKLKPDPAIVHEIMHKTNVNSNEILYVGDSGTDMQTAHNAGVHSCGVTWGFRSRSELEEFCPEHVVDTPIEILKIINTI